MKRREIHRLIFVAALVVVCSVHGEDPTVPVPVLNRQTGEPSAGYVRAQERMVEEVRRKEPELLLIGDSITYNWRVHGKNAREVYLDHRKYVNLGMGGDRVEYILWRMQNGVLDHGRPKLAVVLAGTNNIPRPVDNAQIVEGMRKILEEMRKRQPQMKILLVGVLPRGNHAGEERWRQAMEISEGYRSLADGQHILFLDISDLLTGTDGTFREGMVTRDMLHLDREGYFVWAEAMEPVISQVLGDRRVQRP